MKKLGRLSTILVSIALMMCQPNRETAQWKDELAGLNLSRGEIALCGTGEFGRVQFSLSCKEQVRADFNLAMSLLHSFEYVEAEKVFAQVIDADPECLMAYWGVGMSNFHPLWAPPTPDELTKGSKTMALARTLDSESEREAKYLEAIATIFDDWQTLDHKTRVAKFEKAMEAIHQSYPEDREATIIYALALRAASDPADKSFSKQKKAGDLLKGLFPDEPNHPGIAHYLIHTYDYPELAGEGLPAARKYASIAAASAHAQHMPSHIFTRLGLWDEAIESNLNSTDAARCYAEKLGKAHWDQELHGIDYLVYAYLQQGEDLKAKEQVEYLKTMDSVFPIGMVNAYTFAASPVRYALERKDWKSAASLELLPANFPWEKFQWQRGIHYFGKFLGAANLGNKKDAGIALAELRNIEASLTGSKMEYEANQVRIQIKAAEAWMSFLDGKKQEAIDLMVTAAEMEDATEKHPVTPGEVAPTRELLGDLYTAIGNYPKAAEAYQANLVKRPLRLNSMSGAVLALQKSGRTDEANTLLATLRKQIPLETTRADLKAVLATR